MAIIRPSESLLPRAVLLLFVVAVGGLYFSWHRLQFLPVLNQPSAPWVIKAPNGYNGAYAKALLNGHLYLKEAPPQMAKLEDPYDPAQYGPYYSFDLSYYHGYIYSYFSIAPALLLYLPWTVLTGSYLSEQLGVALFMTLGFALSAMLLVAVRRRYLPGSPCWTLVTGLFVLALGNFSLLLFWPPYYAQVVQSCARFFQVAALGSIFLALQPGRRTNFWLGAASLATGMMVVTRPIFLPAVLLLLPAWFVVARRPAGGTVRAGWARFAPLVATLAPLTVIGLGQMWLNYVRFDSPLEFGTTYQQFGEDLRDVVQFSPAYIPHDVGQHLFRLPTFVRYFPFMMYQAESVGAWVMLPFTWMVLLLPLGWRAQSIADRPAFRALAVGLVIAPAGNLLMLSCYYLTVVRHEVDVVMPLSLAAAVGLLAGAHAWREQAGRRRSLAVIASLLAALNFAVSVSFAATYPNQAAMPQLARLFNAPVYLWEKLRGTPFYNSIRLETVLPSGHTGTSEALASTGTLDSDTVYVHYLDADHVAFGFFHAELGAIESEPLAAPPGVKHIIEIVLGSFCPPAVHPVFSQWTRPEIERAQRQLRITVDGHILLDQNMKFHQSSPGRILIGHAPANSAYGKYSGQLRKLEQIPLKREAPPLVGWPSGGVAFDLQLVNRRLGRSDPLVSTGGRAKGDTILISYPDNDHVQFSIEHGALSRAAGSPVPIQNDQRAHHFELRVTSADPSGRNQAAGGNLTIMFDGQMALAQPYAPFPVSADSVYFGIQTFPVAAEPIFGGRISNLQLLAPNPN